MTRPALRDLHPEQGVRAEIGNIGAIEGLRGLALLWVIAFHYYVLRNAKFDDPWIALVNAFHPLKVIVANGYLGVDLFFLITGFLLTLPWFRHALEGRAAPSARDFYIRRVRRIVPAYYVQLALLFLLFTPLLLGYEFIRYNFYYYVYNIGAHATFLHYTTPISSASMQLNGALWTLALEFQYYLLLPLFAPWFVRAPWRTAVAFVVAATAWRWLATYGMDGLVAFEANAGKQWNLPESVLRNLIATQLPGYLAHFAIGVVVGRSWLLMRPRVPEAGEALAWMILVAVGLGSVYGFHAWGLGPGDLGWLVIPAGLGIAMFGAVSRAPAVARVLLANPPLVFVGRVSYSAYLYHLPLLLVLNKYAPSEGSWLAFPAYLTGVLAFAWLSFRFVEQPYMHSRKPAKDPTWPSNAAPGASEAPSTSTTTTASGAAPSTTIASSSNS